MQARLKAALARGSSDKKQTIDPIVQQELVQLVQEMQQLLQEETSAPTA
ncbi:MAG: hypothetical protein AB8E82_11250 [Aureispira sp.]